MKRKSKKKFPKVAFTILILSLLIAMILTVCYIICACQIGRTQAFNIMLIPVTTPVLVAMISGGIVCYYIDTK